MPINTRSLQNIKQIRPKIKKKKEKTLPNNNSNTKYTEQRIVKAARGKSQVTYINADLLELYPTSQQRL